MAAVVYLALSLLLSFKSIDMNKLSKYIAFALIGFVAASCVTGNDDSEVLREHEEALEKTPRVLNLTVNGETMQRDSLSHWIPVIVKALN